MSSININTCVECKSIKNIHHHHVIPRSLGGTFTIPLCGNCHSKAHGMINGKTWSDHTKLIKKGIERARSEGKQIGAKKKYLNEQFILLRNKGLTVREIAKELKCSTSTVIRAFSENNSVKCKAKQLNFFED